MNKLKLFSLSLLFLLLLTLFPSPIASAHPADMFSHVQRVGLSREGLEVRWEMWAGPILAPAVWALADQNQDELVSDAEAEAYVGQLLGKFSGRLGTQQLVWEVVSVDWPTSAHVWQLGDEPIVVDFRAAWPMALEEGQILALANEFEASSSLNWFYVNASEGVRFEVPTQEKGELAMQVALEGVEGAPAGHDKGWLDKWESGRPTLPAVEQVGLALFDEGEAEEGGILGMLTGLVRSSESSPRFYLLGLTIALVVGALHALTPGHGKTIAAAYLVGTRGTIKHAITLGAVVTLTHTGSVFILGLLTLLASQYILPTTLFPLLEVASGALIVALGLSLLYQRWRFWRHGEHEHGHEHHHPHHHHHHPHHHHEASPPHADDPNVEAIYHSHGDGVGHYHALPKADHGVRWGSLLMLGVSGGLVPCPEAIAILLIAVAINRILLGLSLIVSFSLGLALVLIAIGILMVRSRKLMERLTIFERVEKLAPLISAVVVLFLGIVVTVQGAEAFTERDTSSFSTPAETPASVPFELDDAELLYMATDEMNRFHLFRLPLEGKEAVQLDSAALGLLSYALAPDGEQIVIVARREGGGTEFRLLNTTGATGATGATGSQPEGSLSELLFACAEALCNNPLWSPDGQLLLYEQRESQSKGNVLPTLWWFDFASQSHRAVLPDESLPSYSASWSPDGQWLSYLSPNTNTLQLFHLRDGRVHSIPNKSGYGATWSPNGERLLTYNMRNQGEREASYLLSFTLAEEALLNLSGEANVEDKAGTWSPDGQWIALTRRDLSTEPPEIGNQIWLMRPDGSQSQPLTTDLLKERRALTWSPDSRYLLFQQYDLDKPYAPSSLWLLDTTNRQMQRLVERGSQPTWLP